MALDQQTIQKILKSVEERPRAINELAEILNVNWRTADRYVDKVKQETGKIDTTTFREGTRGALKIAYFKQVQGISVTKTKEMIFDRIRSKWFSEEFTPHTIWKRVPDGKKERFKETYERKTHCHYNPESLCQLIGRAKNSLFIFAGTMRWCQDEKYAEQILDAIKKASEKGIRIRVLIYVAFYSMEFTKKLIQIPNVEVVHCKQPLRGVILDEKKVVLLRNHVAYEKGLATNKHHILYYVITDKEWVEWMTDVFWYYFNRDILAADAIKGMEKIPEFSAEKI